MSNPIKKCPECGIIHENLALQCECGYQFKKADSGQIDIPTPFPTKREWLIGVVVLGIFARVVFAIIRHCWH